MNTRPLLPTPISTSISGPARPPDAISVSMLRTRRRARGIFRARAATIRGQLHDLTDVGRGQRERAIGRRRIEAVAVNGLVEIAERAREGRRQRGGARGRHDAAPAADQQRIVQRGAQAGETVAHRRRGDVQAARGADHAPLAQHGVEHQEQVQIECFKAHDE